MMRAILIIALVVGSLVGGLLMLRGSTRTGMPSDEVIARAKQRERELRAGKKEHGDGDGDA
ncbi:MAG TPA: DUF2897 family protein [Steroidobacteraceae bacterium]|nr:DUF2897 family protein [Steroidobacteraceae bacterium]